MPQGIFSQSDIDLHYQMEHANTRLRVGTIFAIEAVGPI